MFSVVSRRNTFARSLIFSHGKMTYHSKNSHNFEKQLITDIIRNVQFNIKFRHDNQVDTKMSSTVARYINVINDTFNKQSGRDLTLKEIKLIVDNIYY
jgi:hypothetical protein